jgi:hypothetical protein
MCFDHKFSLDQICLGTVDLVSVWKRGYTRVFKKIDFFVKN